MRRAYYSSSIADFLSTSPNEIIGELTRAATMRRSRLLFIAHREEILKQSLGTFRNVLRDFNFGDLLVGGSEAQSLDHLLLFNPKLQRSSALGASLGKLL